MNDDHLDNNPVDLRGSPRIIAEVGGPPDEIRVTLGIHGTDLDPDQISTMLGCHPTSSHRRGDTQRSGQAHKAGAWLLTLEGRGSLGPDELVAQLVQRLPSEPAVWSALRASYAVHVGFGVFVAGWNQGVELASNTLLRLGALGVPIGFDIYCGDE